MTKLEKLQNMLTTHLLKEGQLQLLLPSGMLLEIGITQEDKHGKMVKTENYCWVIASQNDRDVSIDDYNLGLRFTENNKRVVYEDNSIDNDGNWKHLVAVT